ncbi:Hypothetical Protein FCC1311_088132 [Hondaea fermentalgiana]|uniref:Uncharacterized protein n=1 Tax=Hondaea fermentalgiana TaxID=2315210 RepID=A0A2R5GS52_9STRA|nr:Hypothetical Protein FCC1311_088132 [Hondaea fermentalgiana]|eukprot:GBG32588.1 Hypothetical Protein FCC1311_088132 [Hondaea fermentalgiana]
MFFASRKRLIIAYTLYPMIVVFILLVLRLPHPEHEVVDVAVAVGISLGTISFVYHFVRALATGKLPAELDSRMGLANGQEGPLLDHVDLS